MIMATDDDDNNININNDDLHITALLLISLRRCE